MNEFKGWPAKSCPRVGFSSLHGFHAFVRSWCLLNFQRLFISTLIFICPSSFIPGNLILGLSDDPLSSIVTAGGKQLFNMSFALLSSSVWLPTYQPWVLRKHLPFSLYFFSVSVSTTSKSTKSLFFSTFKFASLSFPVNSVLTFLRFFILTFVLLYSSLFPSVLFFTPSPLIFYL